MLLEKSHICIIVLDTILLGCFPMQFDRSSKVCKLMHQIHLKLLDMFLFSVQWAYNCK